MMSIQLLELLSECGLSSCSLSRHRSFPVLSHLLLTMGGIIPISRMSSRETKHLPEVRSTNVVLDGLKG